MNGSNPHFSGESEDNVRKIIGVKRLIKTRHTQKKDEFP